MNRVLEGWLVDAQQRESATEESLTSFCKPEQSLEKTAFLQYLSNQLADVSSLLF